MLTYHSELRGYANDYALVLNARRDMSKRERGCASEFVHNPGRQAQDQRHQESQGAENPRRRRAHGAPQGHRPPPHHLRPQRPQTPLTGQAAGGLVPPTDIWTLSRTELIKRLNSQQGDECGTTQGTFEVHPIRKLKDVAEGNTLWQPMMAARRRKTLILCTPCHHLLHKGKLPEREYRQHQIRAEPCAMTSRTHGAERGVRATR
jgi:AI2M/AI1M-like, HNH endonuclease